MGRPLAITVTGGNTNDCTQFIAVMDAMRSTPPPRTPRYDKTAELYELPLPSHHS
ncbi:hypothetical protein ACIBBE_24580 [Streptomyces sp. NPDC051644]|uniref:hypothetical protein n=1 Tax=Streptomyces sp. NPDC051644 TaxID=3365666 RepID=UPI0037BC2C38